MDAGAAASERLLEQQAALRLRRGRAGRGRRRRADRRRRRTAGVSAASFSTRDAAGCRRSCSASKSRPCAAGDDDLAVDDAARGQARRAAPRRARGSSGRAASGRGSGCRVVAVAEDDGAKAVPLGLEEPAVARRAAPPRASPASARSAARSGSPSAVRRAISSSCAPRGDAARRRSSTPASKGCPGWSRSITSGAWSEGIGLPLRASRSISAHTVRAATGSRHQQVIDAHAEVLVEVAGAVVPPGVAAGLGVVQAVGVDAGPSAQSRANACALGRRDVRAAVAGPRVPDVGVRRARR